MFEKKYLLAVLVFLFLTAFLISCGGDTKKTRQACIDYLKKVAKCTMSDEDTRDQYMFENRAACDDVTEDSWNYQKIYPCRHEKDCDVFLTCVDDNTTLEPESDADMSDSSSSDGNSSSCDKQCNCTCSCGDTTLTSIESCLDCITDCESECQTYCGD